MNGIMPYPTYLESIDDILNVTMSSGQVVAKGPVNGYPGLQMSYLGVDPEGTAYWIDALETRTDISTIATKVEINYDSTVSGIWNGLEDLSSYYLGLLDVNDYIEIDKSLLRTFPAVPTSISNVGYTKYVLENDIVVSTSDVYSNNGALNGVSDNTNYLTWAYRSTDKWLLIEYPEPVLIVAFDYGYSRWSTSYVMQKGTVQTSKDGVTWTDVHYIEDGAIDHSYVRIPPTVCKYIRLVVTEGNSNYTSVGKFIPFTSRTESVLGYNIDEMWFDPASVRLVEHDNYFEVAPVFSEALDVEDAIYLSDANLTTIVASGADSLYRNVYTNSWHLYKFNQVLINNVGVLPGNRSFILPKGHYQIDYNYLLKTDVGVDLITAQLAIIDMATMLPLDDMLRVRTDGSSMDAYPIQGAFEFYIDKPTQVGLGLYGPNKQFSYSDSTDYHCKLDIRKLSDSLLVRYLPTELELQADHLLGGRNDLEITYSGGTLHDVDLPPIYDVTDPTITESYSTQINLDGDSMVDIHIKSPDDIVANGVWCKQIHSTYNFTDYELLALINGEWVSVTKVHKSTDILYDAMKSQFAEVSAQEWKVRITGMSRTDSLRIGHIELLHTNQSNRLVDYRLHTATSGLTSTDIKSGKYTTDLKTVDGTQNIEFTVDTQFNVWLASSYSILNTTNAAVILYHKVDGTYVLVDTDDLTHFGLNKYASDLPAGTYKLVRTDYIDQFFIQEA